MLARLAAAGALLAGSATPQERAAAPGIEELARELRASHPKSRRGAVRELATLGTRDAWRLVFRALADPESEVADEAQLRLADLRDERALAELLDEGGLHARDEWTRRRAAEALGRASVAIDAQTLARQLISRDPELSRLLLWSIERLARRSLLAGDRARAAERLTALVLGDGEWGVRAAGLCALAALDGERATTLLDDALRARGAELRCAAVRVAGELGAADALAIARRAAADDSPAVRAQAIATLERLGTREAALLLAERVGAEQRARGGWRAVDALQRLSGLKYRRDAQPWQVWAERLPADWRPGEGAPGRPKSPEWPGVPGGPAPPSDVTGTTVAAFPATFAGLPVRSDRVCFLVDFSGSMWQERKSGLTVKQVVDRKLAEALGALPDGVRFNLIPYTNEPLPWDEHVVEASDATRRRALDFFVGCLAHGRGNLYDAALTALADTEVDSLMIWTDGVPTGGHHSNLELVVPLLLERNRFRQAAFDLVLVDSPRGSTARLARLAQESGGLSVEITLESLARELEVKQGGE